MAKDERTTRATKPAMHDKTKKNKASTNIITNADTG